MLGRANFIDCEVVGTDAKIFDLTDKFLSFSFVCGKFRVIAVDK